MLAVSDARCRVVRFWFGDGVLAGGVHPSVKLASLAPCVSACRGISADLDVSTSDLSAAQQVHSCQLIALHGMRNLLQGLKV